MKQSVKKYLLWFWLLIKSQLKSPAMLVFLIGLPVICTAVSMSPAANKTAVPRIALFVEDGDKIAYETIKHLVKGDYSVEFYVAKSRDELWSDVGQNIADHGYYIKDGFTKRLNSMDYEESIVLVTSSGSGVLIPMTQEIVFSEMFKVYAEEVAADFVADNINFKDVKEEAVQSVRADYQRYGDSDDTFHISFETLDESGHITELKEAKTTFPIRGVLGILVMVAGLYGGVWWKTEQKKGLFVAMPVKLARMGRFLYILTPVVLFAISSEITLALTKTADYPMELVAMLLYIAAVVIYAGVLTAIIPDAKVLISVIPVLVICCLVFCPVLVDLSPYSKLFVYIRRLLLPYYYMYS